MTQDVIDIPDDDFGVWYVDVMDHPDRYKDKLVHTKLVMCHSKKYPGVDCPGRFAMKKLLALLCAVGITASLCCACGKTQETVAVRLNEVTHSVFYAPQYAAIKLGFFTDEGLDVELTNGGGADKVMTAVLAGQSDIGLAGPEACIYVYNQGKEDYPRVFAQLTKRDGSFLVGRENVSFNWSDLKGKTIIGGRAGGVPEMTLEYVMNSAAGTPLPDTSAITSAR